MRGTVSDIWRHPVKSHGREALDRVRFTAGQAMPWDRVWAVAHEAAGRVAPQTGWLPPASFSTCRSSPALAAIDAVLDEARNLLTLTHPGREAISVNLDDPADCRRFIEWTKPLVPASRAQPAAVHRAGAVGFTDMEFPWISINSHASLSAVADRAGKEVSPLRWRGNVWVDGIEPWAEFDWIGRTVRMGEAEFRVIEPITRCKTTTADPETGERNLDTLALLESGWGHQDFGVYAEVVASGWTATGDGVAVAG